MGLFNTGAPSHSDLNLLLQVFTFILLFGGAIIAKFRRRFNMHGIIMGIAVVLNTLSIGIVMIPSLLNSRGLLSAPFSYAALIIILHIVAGILVEILGIWLVAIWGLSHRNTKACARKKNAMRATAFSWFVELLLGIYVYVILYVPI